MDESTQQASAEQSLRRWALVQGGVVANVVEQAEAPGPDWTPAGDAGPGWVQVEDGSFVAPEHRPAVPHEISRAQGKIALLQAGLWAGALSFVAAIPDEQARAIAEVALHDTQTWSRDSSFMQTFASALGVTDEQMDRLFIAAAQIKL